MADISTIHGKPDRRYRRYSSSRTAVDKQRRGYRQLRVTSDENRVARPKPSSQRMNVPTYSGNVRGCGSQRSFVGRFLFSPESGSQFHQVQVRSPHAPLRPTMQRSSVLRRTQTDAFFQLWLPCPTTAIGLPGNSLELQGPTSQAGAVAPQITSLLLSLQNAACGNLLTLNCPSDRALSTRTDDDHVGKARLADRPSMASCCAARFAGERQANSDVDSR